MKVFVYTFTGKYQGKPEYEFKEPQVGEVHKCILFLGQHESTYSVELAEREITKFGFRELKLLKGRELKVESLNLDACKKFIPHYEGAINEGSSLAWYPNT
jgi:hypothetical protein